MNRIKELKDSIKEHWAERTQIKKKYLAEHCKEMKPGFSKKLESLIEEQKHSREDGTREKVQSFYLYRLLTGIYTESYEVILGIADTNSYLDEDKSETYWFPELVYRHVDEDMKEVETLLRKKFIRLQDYELFQLKKILLDEDWKLLRDIFLQLIKDSRQLMINSGVPMEDELQILAGDYMGAPEILGCIAAIGDIADIADE